MLKDTLPHMDMSSSCGYGAVHVGIRGYEIADEPVGPEPITKVTQQHVKDKGECLRNILTDGESMVGPQAVLGLHSRPGSMMHQAGSGDERCEFGSQSADWAQHSEEAPWAPYSHQCGGRS